ncbi:MAG: PAS domain-containing protein [Candidatus Brocadiales bacterium]
MGRPLKVLIVEDSEDDTALLVRELRKGGYDMAHERVETSSAMEKALAKQEWDVIVADYNLPNFSAPAALSLLQKKGLDLPFIMVSGKVGEDVAVEAMKAGAHDYIAKGNLSRLVPAVGRELREARGRQQRSRTEEQLRKLSHAVEQSPSVVIITDTKGTIEYVNTKFTQITGYTSGEATGKNPRILRSGKTPPEVYKELWETITSGGEWHGEFCDKKKNGELYWEDVSISPVRDSKGVITHFVAVKEDITERKQMEEQIKESHRGLTRAQQIAHLGSWEWTVQTGEVRWSDETYRILGVTPEEYTPKYETFPELIHPDDREHREKAIDAALKNNKPYKIDYRVVRPDGSLCFIHSEAEVEFDREDRPLRMIGTLQDVTERRQPEEQIRTSLKEKEELLNEIHHRVKNNLQIISSLFDMSSMRTESQEAIDLFTDARSKINAMSLIHSELYRSERFDQINLEEHTRKLVEYLVYIYAKGKDVKLCVSHSHTLLPVTQAIPCALILNELVSNALKHAYKEGEKGTIRISMKRLSDATVYIKVKDDGSGMPDEVDVFKADSLGLKLVRNLVQKQLNGEISLGSDGKGTEFNINFTLSKEGVDKEVAGHA